MADLDEFFAKLDSRKVLERNEQLSEPEHVALRVAFTQHRAEIKIIEDQIQMLRARQAVLASHITKYEPLLSLLRSFTAEILGRIFEYCQPYTSTIHCPPKRWSLSQPPWTLTRVCRRWRDISSSTGSLWNSIHVSFNPMSPMLTADVLGNVLRRSASQKLHIEISSEQRSSSQNPINANIYEDDVLNSIRLLVNQSCRWADIVIKVTHGFPPSAVSLLREVHGRLDSLRSCELSLSGSPEVGTHQWLLMLSAFDVAPLLRTLKVFVPSGLNNLLLLPEGEAMESLKFPWAQLKALETDIFEPQSSVSILARCTNLEHLTLPRKGPGNSVVRTTARVGTGFAFKSLKSLSTPSSLLICALSNVVCPSLSELGVRFVPAKYFARLPSFILPNTDKLVKLSLKDIYNLDPNHLVYFKPLLLRLPPTLEILDLDTDIHSYSDSEGLESMINAIIEALSEPRAGEHMYLPNLQRLSLNVVISPGKYLNAYRGEDRVNFYFFDDSFVDMLKFRCRRTPPLKQVSFFFRNINAKFPRLGPAHWEYLAELKKQGLGYSILDSTGYMPYAPDEDLDYW